MWKISNYTVNGMKVIKELHFYKEEWSLIICGVSINMDMFGFPHKVQYTESTVKSIAHLVETIDLCMGRCFEESIQLPKRLLKEIWSNKENKEETRLRSTRCSRVIPFTNTTSCCRSCQIDMTTLQLLVSITPLGIQINFI